MLYIEGPENIRENIMCLTTFVTICIQIYSFLLHKPIVLRGTQHGDNRKCFRQTFMSKCKP